MIIRGKAIQLRISMEAAFSIKDTPVFPSHQQDAEANSPDHILRSHLLQHGPAARRRGPLELPLPGMHL